MGISGGLPHGGLKYTPPTKLGETQITLDHEKKMTKKQTPMERTFVSRKVKPSDVLEDPKRFQMRERKTPNPGHVDDLLKAIKLGDKLPTITLWEDPNSGKLYVLDGHHRLAAVKKTQTQTIPVKVFQGELREARLIAFRANKEAHLPVSNKERQDAAWALVCQWTKTDDYAYSITEVVKSTGISRPQATNMRKARKALEYTSEDEPGPWLAAKMKADGKDPGRPLKKEDEDALREAQVNELRAKIGSQIIEAGYKTPEALAELLRTCLGENYHTVISFMGLKEDDEEDEDVSYFVSLGMDTDPDADY